MSVNQMSVKMSVENSENQKGFSNRNWCFTINNYTDMDIVTLNNIKDNMKDYNVNKIGWNLEVAPTTGMEHIQGFITFRSVRTMKGVKKVLGNNSVHLEVMRGSIKDNIEYCSKSTSRKAGTEPVLAVEDNQGSRTDIISTRDSIRNNGLKSTILNDEFADPITKYHKAFEMFDRVYKEHTLHTEMSKEYEKFIPCKWQEDIIELIKNPADPRKINWIWEKYGNIGKSELMNYLCIKYNAIELSGKVNDMAYMYNGEPIVCFDIPRTAADNGDSIKHLYNFAEKLKNGRIVSTKYESNQKIFKKPHIIFFANFECDKTIWSKDRYNIINLNHLKGKIEIPSVKEDTINGIEGTIEVPGNDIEASLKSPIEKPDKKLNDTINGMESYEGDAENGLVEKADKKFAGNTILRTDNKFDELEESKETLDEDHETVEETIEANKIDWIEWNDIEDSWVDSEGNTYEDIKDIPEQYLDINDTPEYKCIKIKSNYLKQCKSKYGKKNRRIHESMWSDIQHNIFLDSINEFI